MRARTWIVKGEYRGDRKSTRLAVRIEVQAFDAQGALTASRGYFARLPDFEVASVAEAVDGRYFL